MKRWLYPAISALLIAWLWLYASSKQRPPPQTQIAVDLSNVLNNQSGQGFAHAEKLRTFNFPEDHNAHPEYRIEWWYLTGNLKAENRHDYGYQITFFRTALQPNPAQRQSNWASNQIWMAHLALSDIQQQKHYQAQRISRAVLGLAGIQQQPFKIWLEDWKITSEDDGNFPWRITAKQQSFSLDLLVNPVKPVVLQGEQGLSQKSAEPGNASYYYSFTRLQTTGTITVNGSSLKVLGTSWLDREWSSSALGKDQVGWDWFSLQLDQGEELMFYRIRNKSGQSDRFTQGKWILASAQTISLTASDVELKPIEYWKAESGANYPISWRLRIPKLSQDLLIKAAINDQLMRTSIHYWEGAVRVFNAESTEQIGRGYLEMTGYH